MRISQRWDFWMCHHKSRKSTVSKGENSCYRTKSITIIFLSQVRSHVLYDTQNSYQFPLIETAPAVLLRLKLIGYLLSQQAHATCIHLYIMLEWNTYKREMKQVKEKKNMLKEQPEIKLLLKKKNNTHTHTWAAWFQLLSCYEGIEENNRGVWLIRCVDETRHIVPKKTQKNIQLNALKKMSNLHSRLPKRASWL